MAHISDWMFRGGGSSTTINSSFSSQRLVSKASLETMSSRSTSSSTSTQDADKEKFIWRMQQPSETRKYQLFPTNDKLTITPGLTKRAASPVKPLTLVERQAADAAMRQKMKDVSSAARRRKPSVSDLGPMTTVQETAMDSPTIPGRPPLHERSTSAPGRTPWRKNVLGSSNGSIGAISAIEEKAEVPSTSSAPPSRGRAETSKQPLSPKSLEPLVIPSRMTSPFMPITELPSSSYRSRLDSDIAPEVPPKSARMLNSSPSSAQLLTPLTSYTSSPSNLSSCTSVSTLDERVSPVSGMVVGRGPSPGHYRGQSDNPTQALWVVGHRRGDSETSIMERGRPKKRDDSATKPIEKPLLDIQKAFEAMPRGHTPAEASSTFSASELENLRTQAIGQASQFEVLSARGVDALARELRSLDERCDYLRKTHASLRAGRRNLHHRICSYLRSPRVARFSHEALLKQEEALSELDQSIDDWVSKLEQAENRQTRIRQKLLEHVAAALILPAALQHGQSTPPRSPQKVVSPPRSPPVSRSPPAPRSPVAPQSPAMIPVATVATETTATTAVLARPATPPLKPAFNKRPSVRSQSFSGMGRPSVESIRIYADADVYTLLADVEDEINRMSDKGEETLTAATFAAPRPRFAGKESRSASPYQRVAAAFV